MVDINLLPEDLRKKEENLKEAMKKKPGVFEIKLSTPRNGYPRKNNGTSATVQKPENKEEKKIESSSPKSLLFAAQENEKKIFHPVFVRGASRHYLPWQRKEKAVKPAEEPEKKTEKISSQYVSSDEKKEKKEKLTQRIPKERKRFHIFQKIKSFFSLAKKSMDAVPQKTVQKNSFQEITALSEKHKQTIAPRAPVLAEKKREYKKPDGVDNITRETHTKKVQKKEQPAVNLIPADLSHEFVIHASRKMFISLASLGILGILMILLWGGMKMYRDRIGNESKTLETSIFSIKKTIEEYDFQRKQMEGLKARLIALEDLLTNHVYWTQVFSMLEKYTIDDVYFKSFAATQEGSIILSAVGKDYEAVAKQLVAFQQAKDFISDAKINAAVAAINQKNDIITLVKTHFDVVLNLMPEVFLLKLQEP